jgi:hypothetical protein
MRAERLFGVFLLIYLLLGLMNLDTLPVIWNDEVQNLDPAVQHLQTGNWVSWLWPNPGATERFASYPPFVHHWHRLMLCIFPLSPFWVRLPFLLITCLSLWALFHILKRRGSNAYLALGLTVLFAWDRSVFEISRSVRVEPLAMALVIAYAWGPRSLWLRSFILCLLPTCHLLLAPLALALFLFEWTQLPKTRDRVSFLVPAVLIGIYLLYHYNWDITNAYHQMSYQISKHSATLTSNGLNELLFTYQQAPFQDLFFLTALVALTYSQIRSGQHNIWLYALGLYLITLCLAQPLHRYWPMAWLLLALALAPSLSQTPKWLLGLGVLALINGASLYAARHFSALADRPARLSQPALAWLDQHLKSAPEGSLIIGSALAAYAAYQHPHLEYGMPDYLQTFHHPRKAISDVYVLDFGTGHRGPDALSLPPAICLGVYEPSPAKSAAGFNSWPGESYRGMKLYRLKNPKDWVKLMPQGQP